MQNKTENDERKHTTGVDIKFYQYSEVNNGI